MGIITIHKGIEINPEKGELLVYGTHGVIHDPVQIYHEMDLVLGSSVEVLVHVTWYRDGYREFESAIERQKHMSKEEVLQELAESDRYQGWGITSFEIQEREPLKILLRVKNPPVKSIQGSAIRTITGWWCGAFSKCYEKRLVAHDLQYDASKDEFTCTINP